MARLQGNNRNMDNIGWRFGVVIIIVAFATALVILNFTGLTDRFINSFGV